MSYINLICFICFIVPVDIITHPQAVDGLVGQSVTLSCEATGSNPIRYQWRRVNGEITSDRANGVNTSTLTISSVTEQDEDEYYCVASNGESDGLLYTVICQIRQWLLCMVSLVINCIAMYHGPYAQNI